MGVVFTAVRDFTEITSESNISLSDGDDILSGTQLRFGTKLLRIEVSEHFPSHHPPFHYPFPSLKATPVQHPQSQEKSNAHQVIEADANLAYLKYPGTPGKNGLLCIVDQIDFIGRNSPGLRWGSVLSDRFIDGTPIPNGRVRYLSRVLRPGWKREDRGAWELRASPVINISRPPPVDPPV